MILKELDPTIETLLLQADDEQAQQLFDQLMRNSARLGLLRAMELEVDMLCGPKHHPTENPEFKRAGSESGLAFINDEKHDIKRPRVRTTGAQSEEVNLETYRLARQQTNVFDQVKNAVAAGATMRGLEACKGGAVKKTQASEMWVAASLEVFQEFRNRSLLCEDWIAIMLDGVFLGRDQCVVVAIGIHADGAKQVLDFEIGASENTTTCTALLERLVTRGFGPAPDRKLIALCDGSPALRKAVFKYWPDIIYQECQIHTQRVALGKLPKKYHEEANLEFKKLRNAQGEKDAEEAFDELCVTIKARSEQAGLDIEKRKDSLLAFQRLGLPNSLNKFFLNTNMIENVFRNFRAHTKGIKRWQDDTMINRWVSTGLLKAESGFNKVAGYKDLPQLLEALKKDEGS